MRFCPNTKKSIKQKNLQLYFAKLRSFRMLRPGSLCTTLDHHIVADIYPQVYAHKIDNDTLHHLPFLRYYNVCAHHLRTLLTPRVNTAGRGPYVNRFTDEY